MRKLLIAAAVVALGCSRSPSTGGTAPGSSATEEHADFGKLSIDELQAKMDEAKAGKLALLVVDNNTKDTFEKGHIPGAKWVKSNAVEAKDLPADKETTLVFYCANDH